MTSPKLEHYSRTVEDAGKVSEFFIKYFGFRKTIDKKNIETPYFREIVAIPDGTVTMVFLENEDGFMIELFEFLQPKGQKQDLFTNNPGSTHLCFLVDDIFSMVEEMQKDGVKTRTQKPVYVDRGHHEGSYAIYVLDPEETIIELIQLPKV